MNDFRHDVRRTREDILISSNPRRSFAHRETSIASIGSPVGSEWKPRESTSPPTRSKRPLVALLKQARAFGVGLLLATQNPMDLDYRTLSNAGLWCIGRLQTDADRARVVDGLASARVSGNSSELHHLLGRLAPRWFVVRNAHVPKAGNILLRPRQTMSILRGPMTRNELRKAVQRMKG